MKNKKIWFKRYLKYILKHIDNTIWIYAIQIKIRSQLIYIAAFHYGSESRVSLLHSQVVLTASLMNKRNVIKVVYIYELYALIFKVFAKWSFSNDIKEKAIYTNVNCDVSSRALLLIEMSDNFLSHFAHDAFDGKIRRTICSLRFSSFLFRALHIFHASCCVREPVCPICCEFREEKPPAKSTRSEKIWVRLWFPSERINARFRWR